MHSSEHKGTENNKQEKQNMTEQKWQFIHGICITETGKTRAYGAVFRSQEGTLQIEMTRYQHMLFKPRAEPAVAKTQI